MIKKYELTDDTIIDSNSHVRKLHRIRALIDFDNVKKGDLGGYIEKEDCLSHDGNCWVFDDAEVSKNSKISGNAQIYNNVTVHDDSKVDGDALIYDRVNIAHGSHVYGDTVITGGANIINEADISSYEDIMIVCSIDSNMEKAFYINIDKEILVSGIDFICTIDEFRDQIIHQYGGDKICKEYMHVIEMARMHFDAPIKCIDDNHINLNYAIDIARKYYDDKTYDHAIRVMQYVADNKMIDYKYKYDCLMLAIMHDLIEDTEYNGSELPRNFKNALFALTRDKSISYIDYIKYIHETGNIDWKKCAYWVKIADMKDHLSQTETLTDKLKDKYLDALPYLL